jgi:predicted alpha/beta-fold hydrolase
VREHLPSLAAHGTQLDAAALDAVGWTVGSFDDAVTLKQLGYRDGDDCE